MIDVNEAHQIVLDCAGKLAAVQVDLVDGLGCILADDIVSYDDIPPFDNSAMDGFAVRSVDTANASEKEPVGLRILGDEPAGQISEHTVEQGTTVRIMTGAKMIDGADAVVQVEYTDLDRNKEGRQEKQVKENGFVQIYRPVKVSENVRFSGEDIKRGETVLKSGMEIGPAEVGVLASLGYSKVTVIRPVKVSIITTGDELVGIDQPLEPGKIRNSNAFSLFAQVLQARAIPIQSDITIDTKEALVEKVTENLTEADVIITTGGVSVGDYDVVKDVMASLGAELKFWCVKQKPGKPLAFWVFKNKLVFGLPGNPVATMVCFEEYVRPALRKMMGHQRLFRPSVKGFVVEGARKKPGRLHFLRVAVEKRDNMYYASTTGPQGSGILKSMVTANGLALIPAEVTVLKPDEPVELHLIDMPEDH